MDESAETYLKESTKRRRSPYCILCAVFRAFTLVIIVVGIIFLVMWLVLQPDDLKVYVEDASLSRFDLSPNNTLSYNLTLDVSFRNPSSKVGVHYKSMEAAALYGGSRFGSDTIPAFHQGRKSTAVVHPRFHGVAAALGGSAAATFEREKGEGLFSVSIRIYTRVRLKRVGVKSVEYRPEVDCYVRLPVAVNGTAAAGGFTRTQCHVDSFS